MRILVRDGIGTAGSSSGVVDITAHRLAALTGAAVEWVSWPAAMAGVGGRSTWTAGARRGLADLRRRVGAGGTADWGDELVLLAYSGGNRIVHDFLDAHPEQLGRVRAVGLMSDPFRPRDRFQAGLPEPGGWGLCGERLGPIPERTRWCAVPGDVITAAEPDAILRTVADVSANVPGGLRRDVAEILFGGRFQLVWQVDSARRDPLGWLAGLGGRLARARLDVERYFTGWHTTNYTRRATGGGPGVAELFADELYELVGEGAAVG